MRILVIPDVHLKPKLFDYADELLGQGVADKALCLMDLPDEFGQEYNLDLYDRTFEAAIGFARKRPETLWCYGNHEFSYLWNMRTNKFSTFCSELAARRIRELRDSLPDPSLMAIAHRIGKVIFLHGGLTEDAVRQCTAPEDYADVDKVIDNVNRLLTQDFLWWDSQSPVWYRPQISYRALYDPDRFVQVVGHTPVEQIRKDGCVISCDVFSRHRNGLPIGNRRFPVIDTETGNWTEHPVPGETDR